MSSIWRFLSGEVPGGFALPLVGIICLLLILEYVYRTGQTMPHRTYLRWRWMGPCLVLVIYALFWIQAPPKLQPIRVAVIPEDSSGQDGWRSGALADLTGRCLKRTLSKAIVNPWQGAVNDYQQPSPEVLQRSGYRVYSLRYTEGEEAKPAELRVQRLGRESFSIPLAKDDLAIISSEIGAWILRDLGKKSQVEKPFSREFRPDVFNEYYLGERDFRSQNYDSAEVHYNRALEVDPGFLLAKVGLAWVFEERGFQQAAETAFLEAAREDTSSMEFLLYLGEFYVRLRQWDLAEAPLKVVLAKRPLEVRTYLDLTRLHPERLGDLRMDSPDKLLAEAVRLDPAFENARIALISLLIEGGLAQRALPFIKDGLNIYPDSEGLLLKMGAVEFYSGNADASRQVYQKILSQDPGNAAAEFNLGIVAYRTKQYEEAVQYFLRSIEKGGTVDNYYYLGIICRTLGDNNQAIRYFDKRWDLRKDEDDAFGLKSREYADELRKKMVE